jgi:uncharacterized protein (TIGR02246 family)
MKALFFAAFLMSFTLISYAQSSKDTEEVIRVSNSFFKSWNKHDFSDMANYTTDDVTCVINVGILWKGRTRVQAAHENAHRTLMKTTGFTPEPQSISPRFITSDVAVVTLVAKMDAYYPPDGVNHGSNKAGDDRVMVTMVELKKNNKWLITSIQGTDINPQAEASIQHD